MDSDDFFLSSPASREIPVSPHAPLAARMRPETLDEVLGQAHLLGEGKLLRRTLQADRLVSAIFFGPPGCGKTTLARIISKVSKARFMALNAVTSNVAEVRKVIEEARRLASRERTVLFIDEIHRFNKAQQDVLMPDVENGIIILVGATTHNPSFSVNGPLLSRSLIFELRPLEEKDLVGVMRRALQDKVRGYGDWPVEISEEALAHIARQSAGDGRRALNALEVAVLTTPKNKDGAVPLTLEAAEESCQRKVVYYDRDEDYHYDTVSAFIKSLRGSDPDAAIYWLAKMIYAGEDPRFIVRRLLILASEDIGNADPQALVLASACLQAVEFVGMPESQLILAQTVAYLACAPKSNAATLAISEALEDVRSDRVKEVPKHLRDSHYKGAEKLGHGEGYQYPHNFDGAYVPQNYMPEPKAYYRPTSQGFEKQFQDHLRRLRQRPKPTF